MRYGVFVLHHAVHVDVGTGYELVRSLGYLQPLKKTKKDKTI